VATGSSPLAGKLTPEYPEWSGCQSQRRRVPARVAICCRNVDPFQGPKLGSCLTLGNELSEDTHWLIKQETLLGKGTQVESSRVREKCKKAKWLSGEALQVAVKRREAKSKGEKEKYKHLNAEFQRIARKDKKAFLSYQCKEIEENNRMRKTRDLFKKIRYQGNISCKDGHNKGQTVWT